MVKRLVLFHIVVIRKLFMVEEPEITRWFDTHYEEFMTQMMHLEGPLVLESEITIANGQQVDKVVYGTGKKILALIEAKGTVNLTDFIRGMGQAFQGMHQIKMNYDENFSENAESFLLVPYDMKQGNIDFTKFNLDGFRLVFVDIENNTIEEFDKTRFGVINTDQWTNISPKWFRDCSLPGLYFMLKIIARNTASQRSNRMTKTQFHDEIKDFMELHDTLFFNDVKNNLITSSKLGFWDEDTLMLTNKGLKCCKMTFHDFCKKIIQIELGEYTRAVYNAINSLHGKCSTKEIADYIQNKIYLGKKVKFLHDDDGGHRNIGTIVRMLETIGSIKRINNNEVTINYAPYENMPFRMREFNDPNITGDAYNDRIEFWFREFNFDFDY